MGKINVVTGPPAAGKSTHVKDSAEPGDVIVDFDSLAVSFGSLTSHDAPEDIKQVTFAAREAAIGAVLAGVDSTSWIIHTQPTRAQLDAYEVAGAEIVTVDPGIDIVLERAAEDGRPDWTADAINSWYSRRKAMPKEGYMQTKSVALTRVKAGPEDGLADGEFIVYPSTFTRTPDSYGDVIAKGAFLDNLAEWKAAGNVIPGLFGHRLDDPDFYVASAIDTGEDDHGWWVKGMFDMESPKGAHVYRLVKGRRLNQLSFAFDVLDEGAVELEDGTKANELRKLRIHEFSFVPIGANSDTSVVAVKALSESIVDGMKAGRVLASKHIDSLRSAQEAIGAVIKAAEASNDEEKASGTPAVPAEEPDQVKAGALSVNPSVARLSAQIEIYALGQIGVTP